MTQADVLRRLGTKLSALPHNATASEAVSQAMAAIRSRQHDADRVNQSYAVAQSYLHEVTARIRRRT